MSAFDFSVKPVEAMRNGLDRLTILRPVLDAPPLSQLVNLMNELLAEDSMPFDISWSYHDLAAAILSSQPPQVTGDRWRDCLIQRVLEWENPFSIACSRGLCDEVLLRAFAKDLSVMHQLFLLDDAMVRHWCTPSQGGQDMSGWTDFSGGAFFIVEGEGPLPTMRRMLLSSEDWSLLARPLMELFAQFGCGAALGHRFLDFDGERLRGVENVPAGEDTGEEALAELLERHAKGERVGPICLTGPRGAARVRAALRPCGLRVVRLQDIACFAGLCQRLRGTHLRAAVLLPMPHPADPLLGDLLGEGLTRPPDNLLPVVLCPMQDPLLAGRFETVL